jgi:peptide/nickel transport system permease protein
MASGSGTSLRRYAITRLALVLPMVFILLTLVFLLMRVAPGDPITASLGGRNVSPAVIKEIKHRLGYDKPLIAQYGNYLWDIMRGDFGETITDRRQVQDIITINGAATLELTVASMLVAILAGVLIGLISGRFRDTPIDVSGRLFGIVIYAMPVFFLGLLLQLVFGVWLGWLPTADQESPITQALLPDKSHIVVLDALQTGNWGALWDGIKHLILPATTLGLVTSGIFVRLIRVNVIRTMKDDYIEAARARGIKERSVVFHHAFRNALVPVITVVGLQLALLLSGAVLTETTFNWPGIGHELIFYLQNRDYAAVQGIIVVFALVVVFVSVIIDFVNALIDPRIRY